MVKGTSAHGTHGAAPHHEDGQGQVAVEADHLPPLSDRDYEQLAAFRATLRQLVRQTELEVAKVGLTPQHYHLMLAIKGFPQRDWATISELAERLQIRHNAVIGLVNRAVARGLVVRQHGEERTDRRTVRVLLTPEGERILGVLVTALRAERQRVRMAMEAMTGDAPQAQIAPSTSSSSSVSH